MKMKAILVLTVLLVAAAKAQEEFVKGVPLEKTKPRRGRANALVTAVCVAANAGLKVCSDVTAPDACTLDATPKSFFDCSATVGVGTEYPCDSNTPYCVTEGGSAKCSATASVANPVCPPGPPIFECQAVGIFPDPLDCKRYFDCYNLAGVLTLRTDVCPSQYVFDPSDPTKTEKYCRYTNDKSCAKVTCPEGRTVNVAMKFDYFPASSGQYVVTCRNGLRPLVKFCPAYFVPDLTKLPVECNLQCPGSYVAPYDADPTKYYLCVISNGKWVPSIASCTGTKVFDPKTKVCVNP